MRAKLLKELEDYKNIYIFGAGYNGRRLKKYLNREGYIINGYVVSDDHYAEEYEKYGEEIRRIADIESMGKTICLISILDEGIKEKLDDAGIKNVKFSTEFY